MAQPLTQSSSTSVEILNGSVSKLPLDSMLMEPCLPTIHLVAQMMSQTLPARIILSVSGQIFFTHLEFILVCEYSVPVHGYTCTNRIATYQLVMIQKHLSSYSSYYVFHIAALEVSISTNPTGPNFPAAIFIEFTCEARGISFRDVINYRWTVSCSVTGSVVSVTEGNSDTFRVHSTPLVCADMVECIVEDPIFQMTGSDLFIITSVVGEP